MQYLIDAIFLLCLLWGAYRGFKRGLIRQLCSVAAVALGIWAGFSLSGMVKPLIHDFVGEAVCDIAAFIIVFIAVVLLTLLSGWLLTKLAAAVSLGLINRLTGAAFGVLANLLILSVLLNFLNRIDRMKPFLPAAEIEQSILYRPIEKVAPAMYPMIAIKI